MGAASDGARDLADKLILPQVHKTAGSRLFIPYFAVRLKNYPVTDVGVRFKLLENQLKSLFHVFQTGMNCVVELVHGILGAGTGGVRVQEGQRVQAEACPLGRISV